MLRVDALTNFTQQALQDSQKAILALSVEQIQIRKVVLQNRLTLDILMAAQGRTCGFIHTQCCTYIRDMNINVTHFTANMNKMIHTMNSPEASVTSLWETLISSPWWKIILILIILIVLFLLFAPCHCNHVTGFIFNSVKAKKLQMVVQALMSATDSSNYYWVPMDQRLSI